MGNQEIYFRSLVVRYFFVEGIKKACLSITEFISECQNGVSKKCNPKWEYLYKYIRLIVLQVIVFFLEDLSPLIFISQPSFSSWNCYCTSKGFSLKQKSVVILSVLLLNNKYLLILGVNVFPHTIFIFPFPLSLQSTLWPRVSYKIAFFSFLFFFSPQYFM